MILELPWLLCQHTYILLIFHGDDRNTYTVVWAAKVEILYQSILWGALTLPFGHFISILNWDIIKSWSSSLICSGFISHSDLIHPWPHNSELLWFWNDGIISRISYVLLLKFQMCHKLLFPVLVKSRILFIHGLETAESTFFVCEWLKMVLGNC